LCQPGTGRGLLCQFVRGRNPAFVADPATGQAVYRAPVPSLRCTLKLKDGRVHVGYTPAFDPADRSLWLTATPDSPAGTMYTLDRLAVVVLETLDGRAAPLPSRTVVEALAERVRLHLADGRSLSGRRVADVSGLGWWVQPSGRGLARAFVCADGVATLELDDDERSEDDEREWSFLPPPPTLPPSRSSLTMPLSVPPKASTVGRLVPPPVPTAPSTREPRPVSSTWDATPTDAVPAISHSELESQRTQPVALPTGSLAPVPIASQTWPDGVEHASSITTPDLARPDLDDSGSS